MLTAIVGIGCRFPGGVGTPAAFWDLLCAGTDATTEVPPGRVEMEAEIAGHGDRTGMLHAVRGGFIEGIDAFDADFFGISPREARRIDPQQRLLLEVVWEALEDGGLPADRLAGSSVGVYVGISSHDYADMQMRPENRHVLDAHVNAGGAASIAANRVSYLLDLKGPSIAVDTACSSALTALHLACRGLASEECDIAIVGAVNALLAAEPTIGFRQAAMLAPDGRCKPFDAAANGYVRSEGAGAIVLKPLDRAVADGDPVYAVIRGTAINQDGRTPGIAVPSLAAQQALLERALDEAGVASCAVQYVEAHGTGTPVGDPVEARAIGDVMSRDRPSDRRCLIGSVKGNVGHLEAAAGIVGVIKAALALRHRRIPPTVNFVEPNPAIPFDELRLRVPTTLEEWPATEGPATACVNSFGFGGANAHAVLEEPPARQPAATPSRSAEILTISARSGEALHELAAAHMKRLRSGDSFSLGDLCSTAAVRRCHHDHRLAAVAGSKQDLADHLDAFLHGEAPAAVADGRSLRDRRPGLAFIFSGMGPQWWGMGRQLLRDEPVFQSALEECDRLLRPIAGWSLLEELAADSARSRITDADLAHVANLAIQVALTELWRSWGIVPDAVAGHSSGEMGAAWAAGALSLPDALHLAFHRGRLQHRTTGMGGMLAAAISLDASHELLGDPESRSLPSMGPSQLPSRVSSKRSVGSPRHSQVSAASAASFLSTSRTTARRWIRCVTS
jgi:acyl transferase domain-containing protein